MPLAAALAGTGPIEILVASSRLHPSFNRAVLELQRELITRFPDDQLVVRSAPPSLHGMLAPWTKWTNAWIDAWTAPGAGRFDAVRVPAWWRDSARRCLVCGLPGQTPSPADRPLARLAALAHPRQRLAARLSRDRAALVAELASPWRPRLILLVVPWRGQRITIASRDLIAAELVWLALAERDQSTTGTGPWEDPAVQRATSLDLGIAGPHQLHLVAGNSPAETALHDLLTRRLGIMANSVSGESASDD